MYGISTVRKILLIKNREKLSIRKTAKRFGLSTSTVSKWDKGIISEGKRICQARKLDMEGIKFTIDSNESISVVYDKNSLNFGKVINYLHKSNVEILDIVTEDGDLEDVFVQLTNR